MSRGDPRLPPGDLLQRGMLLGSLTGVFYRCARMDRPLYDWDEREKSRFSHPQHPFPVLYLARSRQTAFWECFGDDLLDQVPGERALTKATLASRQWVAFAIKRPLRMLDLTDRTTLHAIAADGATFLASYQTTQAWSRALMLHPAGVQALRYDSRLNPGQTCLAIFGRPEIRQGRPRRMQARRAGMLLNDESFARFLQQHQIAIKDSE